MIFQIFRYFAIQPNLNTRYHFSIASYICYPIIVFYIYINLIFYFLIRWKSHLFKFLAQCRSLLIRIKTFRAGFIKCIAREIASTFSSLCKPTNMIFFFYLKKKVSQYVIIFKRWNHHCIPLFLEFYPCWMYNMQRVVA